MAAPFDINKADFLSTLEACHARLLKIQKEDEKRYIEDQDISPQWQHHVDEVLMPAIESIIYWEPTDDEINAPLHA
jgi:hypothetical protein